MGRRVWIRCKALTCGRLFELVDEPRCPECGTPRGLPWGPTPDNSSLQRTVYGTERNPKFNLGLGVSTRGKKDRRLQAQARQMVPYDE